MDDPVSMTAGPPAPLTCAHPTPSSSSPLTAQPTVFIGIISHHLTPSCAPRWMIKRCHWDEGRGCPDIVAAFFRADSALLSLLLSLSAGSEDNSGNFPRLLFPSISSTCTRLDTSKVYGWGGWDRQRQTGNSCGGYGWRHGRLWRSGDTEAGRRMVETDGKGLLMLAHIKTAKNEVVCKLFC